MCHLSTVPAVRRMGQEDPELVTMADPVSEKQNQKVVKTGQREEGRESAKGSMLRWSLVAS